jgi:site-specific DNA-methyltransferase (adenine-specific)
MKRVRNVIENAFVKPNSKRISKKVVHKQSMTVPIIEAPDKTVNPFPQDLINTVLNKSCCGMPDLPNNCVSMIITSPPYNVGLEYDDCLSLEKYLDFMESIFKDCYRVLIDGGRIAVNCADINRSPSIPMHSHFTQILLKLGFNYRGLYIWVKPRGCMNNAFTTGTYRSAKNSSITDIHEYILLFNKGSFRREVPPGSIDTIEKQDFYDNLYSVKYINPEPWTPVRFHPAPFPFELPRQLIQSFTFTDDVIVDPFMGSGTTAIAAAKLGRRYFGYELSDKYYKGLLKRLDRELRLSETPLI